ncbi:MAG: hypothetical protein ABUR63_06275 [Verrucomicrobiota bacterium]
MALPSRTGYAGVLVVNTSAGGFTSDSRCGLEEAVNALESQTSKWGCVWSGSPGNLDTIILPRPNSNSNPKIGDFTVNSTLTITHSVDFMTNQGGRLVTIKHPVAGSLFSVSTSSPITVNLKDLHLIGPGKASSLTAAGIAGEGNAVPGGTIIVKQCWIEQFSESAIVIANMSLTVVDSTLENNFNMTGDGGGAIFYETTDSAANRFDFLNITNSSINRNRSTKGGGLQIQSNSLTRIVNSTISDNLTVNGRGGGISFGNADGTLLGGDLEIIGSTVAFNGSTVNNGAGISNSELSGNENSIILSGSIVANNCLATVVDNNSFKCKSGNSTRDFLGVLHLLSDSLLGSTANTTITYEDGVTFTNRSSGLSTSLSDQGGAGEHHPPVHELNNGSICIDATDFLQVEDEPIDQAHKARNFDHTPSSGTVVIDFGAVERRRN